MSPLFTCQEWLENIGKQRQILLSDSGRTTLVRGVKLSMEEAAAPETEDRQDPIWGGQL